MHKLLPLLLALSLPVAAFAQQAQIDFGGLSQDPSAPVTVDADSLSVNQTEGTATFTGNVRVAQAEMRLSAAEVQVEYGETEGEITRLHATGGVTLANGDVAAEAREATYTIAAGTVQMDGDVLLTQGQSTISGQSLLIDLQAGTGTMQGRVQTLFRPEAKE